LRSTIDSLAQFGALKSLLGPLDAPAIAQVESGFAATSLGAIADHIGVSKGVISYRLSLPGEPCAFRRRLQRALGRHGGGLVIES
jgi:hypothetical protein